MNKRLFSVISAVIVCFLLFFSACTEKKEQPAVLTPPENDDWAAYMPMETGDSWIYESAGKDAKMPGISVTITGKQKVGEKDAFISELSMGGMLSRREYLELIPGKGVYSRRRDSFVQGRQNIFTPDTDDAILQFPIKLGSTWEWDDNSPQKIKGINRFKVAAYEEVTVPSGTYKAFRIDIIQVDISGAQVTTSMWLAKDIGMVKQATSITVPDNNAPPLPDLVFVLKEYVKGKDVPQDRKPKAESQPQNGLAPAAPPVPGSELTPSAPAAPGIPLAPVASGTPAAPAAPAASAAPAKPAVPASSASPGVMVR